MTIFASDLISTKSPIGFTGSQGIQGITGAFASIGYTGSIGSQGTQGIQGTIGAASAIGYSGSQGTQGIQGTSGPSTSIIATDDAATTTLYPVMVGAAGSDQTPKVTTTRFAFNALTGDITQTNPTSGSGVFSGSQTFRLAADGAAVGPAISNYFGANSAISLEAASMYEITIHTFFLKTTAGTLTWTLTASSAPTSVVARNISTPILGTSGVGIVNTVTSLATAATAFLATGSLSTGVNHAFEFRVKVLTNLATNLRLNATQSAGTITPRAGSYYTVRKISASTGTFAA